MCVYVLFVCLFGCQSQVCLFMSVAYVCIYTYACHAQNVGMYISLSMWVRQSQCGYGVATISRLLKRLGLFRRIYSLL